MIIYFDKSSAYWNSDNKANEWFLDHQTDHIRDIVKHRGYVYLNQIHELLGVKWDTRCENLLIEDPGFTVNIGWDCNKKRWMIGIN